MTSKERLEYIIKTNAKSCLNAEVPYGCRGCPLEGVCCDTHEFHELIKACKYYTAMFDTVERIVSAAKRKLAEICAEELLNGRTSKKCQY